MPIKTTRDVTYPKDINRVLLMGGTPFLPKLAAKLRERGLEVVCYTSPRQVAEIGPTSEALTVTEDINATLLPQEITPQTIAIGLGEAWTFGPEIRAALGDRLMGYMGIPLPRYRGGAHVSWAIMRGDWDWGGCLQLVTANTVPGEFDDGELVAKWDYQVPNNLRIPQQWFSFCWEKDLEQILVFFYQITKGHVFHLRPVNERESLFLPRLKTVDNGWIDWNQQAAQLERQICAFDEPYPGARTSLYDPCYGEREVALKGVTWDGKLCAPVPFQRGLVLRVQDGIHIAAVNGIIVARRVLFHGADYTARVKVGMRFMTSAEQLDKAMVAQPVYTPKAAQ